MKARRGRPPKHGEEMELVTVRFPVTLLRRVDTYARRVSEERHGTGVSRSDGLRELVTIGLDAADEPATVRAPRARRR